MRRIVLGLALPLLMSATAVAQEAELTPAQIYQRLTGQSEVPADAPRTLQELRARTGHSDARIRSLLRLPTGGAVELPWADAAALGAAKAKRVATHAAARPALIQRGADVARQSTTDAATLVRDCYRAGARDLAQAVVSRHAQLVGHDDLPAGVTLTATYVGGDLEIVARRSDARAPLAVAFPPGLKALVQGAPGAQDLALLEADVLILPRGARQARLELAVACAGYGYRGPSHGRTYSLQALPTESTTDRLLRRICQGGVDGSAAQLAVWVTDDGVSSVRWSDTQTMRGAPVREHHAQEAAKLILDAGVDPGETRLFLTPNAEAPAAQP